jgi:hypothetical protein
VDPRKSNNQMAKNKSFQNLLIIVLAITVVLPLGYFFIPTGQIKNAQPNINSQSNLKIEVLQEGEGEAITKGRIAIVHYTGTLTDGTKFDSSLDRGEPFLFTLGAGQVIPGWERGVEGMKTGEKRRLTVPSELAYGETGTPGGPIPPNATLIFEIELLGLINPEDIPQDVPTAN